MKIKKTTQEKINATKCPDIFELIAEKSTMSGIDYLRAIQIISFLGDDTENFSIINEMFNDIVCKIKQI